MSEKDKTNGQMFEILARKKAMNSNNKGQFNPNNGKNGKVNTKGFGGPAVTRKTGRGS
jgi:hypothetical protein